MALSFNLFMFKKSIEETLNIIEWNPSNQQLEEMFNEIIKLNGSEDFSVVENIVLGTYGKPIKRMVFNGLDTSKASKLLAKISAQNKGNQQKR
ncbi:S-(hydroxymethyl)glutathione dehydrogenase [Cedecea sp. S5-13]|uniref:S-(hydroxymethyl)glutathione dehydrogenase n=1 Tax=Cedecea selenatireducens TaxID=3144416 RepID=UPI0035CD0B1E